MNNTGAVREILRSDYQVPDWLVETVDITFDLAPTATRVVAKLALQANPARAGGRAAKVVLNGEKLTLISAKVAGKVLTEADYELTETDLTFTAPSDAFEFVSEVEIDPKGNTALEGLYQSNGKYCTQCEAEGFRCITYFPDRPDVMSVYTVTIRAPREGHHVLLSNGNLEQIGMLADGRHFARWHDPFPKPCYLFALVAGDLAVYEDSFTTQSGRDVTLRIFVEEGNEDRCAYAMDALKRSMKWDEEVYGLEYDLDLFNIVAVSDFNMGAMENKSLNIFNAKYILAKPETATDADYAFIEAVVAHEYFHNWTGNRVTCRDWFQLSLKEGLTVFRDQEFSADMRSRPVQRINQVQSLRGRQFPEDAGPLSHPVRPDSYIEINNFYTATVYEKGAEVIRMMHALLGADAYRKGIDLYFERHDGTAATCDDFVAAMEDANEYDLTGFRRWYSQAGTPKLSWQGVYDAAAGRYVLTVAQETDPTPGQKEKQALTMPLKLGLLAEDGQELVAVDEVLSESEQIFTYEGLSTAPAVVSLNRGFLAPIKVTTDLTPAQSALLMAHDTDPFNRFEAAYQYAIREMVSMTQQVQSGEAPLAATELFEVQAKLFGDGSLDPLYRSQLMSPPSLDHVADRFDVIDIDAIARAWDAYRAQQSTYLKPVLQDQLNQVPVELPVRLDGAATGRRAFRNALLSLLAETGDEAIFDRLVAQYEQADNMTDRQSALIILANHTDRADALFEDFYQLFQGDATVIDKWFSLQVVHRRSSVLDRLEALADHPDFTLTNPNRFRSLVGAFITNMRWFHDRSGRGYEFVAEKLYQLDEINPQTTARMATGFGKWKRFDEERAAKMKAALERLRTKPSVSKDLLEITTKSLDG